MNEETLQRLERRLEQRSGVEAPATLRAVTLAQVERELRAARWDRRLMRCAAGLLAVGVGMNIAAGLTSERYAPTQQQTLASNDGLVQTAVAVAQVTDAETGRLMARQLAAWQGRSVTPKQLAAIDAALNAVSQNPQL